MNNELTTNNITEAKIELSENTLNSLNLLVEAAKKTSKEQEINALEQELAQLKEEKTKKEQELDAELEQDMRELNAKTYAIKHSVDKKNGVSRTNLDIMKKRLEEYEQDFKEQEEKMQNEKRQLEEIEKLPQTRENMLKKADLEWGLIAYTEYLDFIEEEIEELKGTILELEAKVKASEKEAYDEINKHVIQFNKKYNVEYGNKNPTIDNHPIMLVLNTAIQDKEAEVEYYKQDPEELKNEIVEAMKNGDDPKVIKQKLNTLTSLIGGKVSGIIDFEQLNTLEEQFAKLQEEKINVETRINEDDYINVEARKEDEKTIEQNKKDLEVYQQEINKLEEQLKLQEEKRKIPAMKRHLQELNKHIKTEKSELEFVRKYGKEEAIRKEHLIRKYIIERQQLENKITQLEDIPKLTFKTGIKHEIVEYVKKISKCEKEIEELSIKTDEDYIDWDRKNEDLLQLEVINQDINVLTEKRNALGEHDPYEITEDILKEYQIKKKQADKEEIFDFKEATQHLIDKIRSLEFKEKAISAISSIASVFKKKERFDYEQIIDNVTESMNEVEENVKDSEESIEKGPQYSELGPEYNDPAYGMEEKNIENTFENNETVRTR